MRWLNPLTDEANDSVSFASSACLQYVSFKNPGPWHSCGCQLKQTICINTLADQVHLPMAHWLHWSSMCAATPQRFLKDSLRNMTKPEKLLLNPWSAVGMGGFTHQCLGGFLYHRTSTWTPGPRILHWNIVPQTWSMSSHHLSVHHAEIITSFLVF